MKRPACFSGLICLSLVITSCSTIKISMPGSSRNAWVTKWLNSPTCQIPCWENIVPGVTTTDDALKLLSQIPNIKITNPYGSSIEWVIDGTDTGWIDQSNNLVISITLNINRGERIMLSEIDDAYGLPTQARLYRCLEGSCEVHLTYPNHGMVIILGLSDQGSGDDQVDIKSDSLIGRIMLFQSLDRYYSSPDYAGGSYINWKGYTTYP